MTNRYQKYIRNNRKACQRYPADSTKRSPNINMFSKRYEQKNIDTFLQKNMKHHRKTVYGSIYGRYMGKYMHRDMQRYVQRYGQTCKDMQRYAKTCKGMQRHAKTRKDMQRHTKKCKDGCLSSSWVSV